MTFRGALIGCGFFARNHMYGWADAEGAEIVAVCDLDREKAEAFARDFGIERAFADAGAMLAEVRPDFVDVATTIESHRRLVELGLLHGALTICQKPFAASYVDALAMVEAAERAGRPLLVHENFRWQRPFRALHARLEAGDIGRPQFARLTFRHGFDVYVNQPYLLETQDFALMDVGLHLFDLARRLMGEVTRVACETQRLNPRVRGEDAFTALLRHDGGAVTSVECCFFSQIAPEPFPQTLAWIEGADGTLELGFDYALRLHRAGKVEAIKADPPLPAWGERPWHAVQDSVAAFEAHVVAVLRGEAEPQPSGRHNLGTLALTLAAYRSAARGETVDMAAFVAAGGAPVSARIEADYLIETAYPLTEAAAAMAGEQSSGTFLPVPGETPELKARAAAAVERIEDLGPVERPSLPGAGRAGGAHQGARVTLSWPLANLGPSLPNLLATVAGNLFELRQFAGLRLLDLRLPEAFAEANPGPAFGVEGTRRLSGVEARPLIGTIVKPSVGLDAGGTAALVGVLCGAGIDFVKDDELQADGPGCPFEERARAVMAVIDRHADRTGKKAMFAFNVTGEVDEMRRRHDLVARLGGTCVMVSIHSVGLTGMLALRRHSSLPIHAHRNGWGALSRHPALGFEYVAWAKLWRLAGADHMHVNGLRNKFCEPDASVVASARSCLAPLWEDRPCVAMPVFSSGQSVAQVADTWAALGSVDLIYAAGGGIMGHPGGPAEGVAALRAAWEAAMAGVPAKEAARTRPALAAALEAFA